MDIERLFAQLKSKGLTGRQAEIVLKVMDGKKNAQIAAEIGIGEKTVKFHLTNIYKLTGMRDRYALSIWANQILGESPENNQS
jgi:DNA-binding CsgD family transcriptional regulator